MNRHLTAREIAEWFSGQASPEAERHVAACTDCRSGIDRFADVLADFRGTVHQWSASRLSPGVRVEEPHRGVMIRALGPVCVAAVILVMVAASILLPARRVVKPETGGPDTALLQRVEAEVSRSVPGPMEPLMSLVGWDESEEPHPAGRAR